MKIDIVTRCTRPENLPLLKNSIFRSKNIINKWHIAFDTNAIKLISTDELNKLSENNANIIFHFLKGNPGETMFPEISKLASKIKHKWLYFLDDDNLLHPEFNDKIENIIKSTLKDNENLQILCFSQYVGGKDFSGLYIREAKPENTSISKIDVAQMLIKSDVFHKYKFGADYTGEGMFVDEVYAAHPEWFGWNKTVLSLYNAIESKPKIPSVPKILYVGGNPDDAKNIKSFKFQDYESDELNVKYVPNDKNIWQDIASFNPDNIITRGENWNIYPILSDMPYQFRKKWIHIPDNDTETNIGQTCYTSFMINTLDKNNFSDFKLVSFFTPMYNTGNKLLNTYQSLLDQTYDNWEWVLVDDSTDNGKTLKIAESIAEKDPRVKVYDIYKRSNNIIGEAKYRAAVLTRGDLIAELDHDDILTPNCAADLYNASIKYPNCGFFYTDSAEVNPNFESMTYPDGFSFGYGKYRKEKFNDKELDVCTQPNINPKTIRHIVGVPNHVRAWKRNVYFAIGGHNRNLSVADDYELIVRTFLNTKMCKIPKLGYIQFIYNDGKERNSHDSARADIQRRVRTIAEHYNESIKNRFNELGLVDWAYDTDKENPLNAISRYGKNEQMANITYVE